MEFPLFHLSLLPMQNDAPEPSQPLPQEYRNKIISSDNMTILKRLPNNCIDVIITSPPYNYNKQYDNYNDKITWNSYFSQLFQVITECYRVLKSGGRLIINIEPSWNEYVSTHHIISVFCQSLGFLWRNEILWEKNSFSCPVTKYGSYASPSTPFIKATWEYVEILAKGSYKHESTADPDITPEEFKAWSVGKWTISPERNAKKYNHPAMFPEKLAYRLIKLFSFPRDVVCDIYNGVGTTTAVASLLNRTYLGIDLSSTYCEIARSRIDSSHPIQAQLRFK